VNKPREKKTSNTLTLTATERTTKTQLGTNAARPDEVAQPRRPGGWCLAGIGVS
jgi:hypothetical protein